MLHSLRKRKIYKQKCQFQQLLLIWIKWFYNNLPTFSRITIIGLIGHKFHTLSTTTHCFSSLFCLYSSLSPYSQGIITPLHWYTGKKEGWPEKRAKAIANMPTASQVKICQVGLRQRPLRQWHARCGSKVGRKLHFCYPMLDGAKHSMNCITP